MKELLKNNSSDKIESKRLVLSRIHLIAYLPILLYIVIAVLYFYLLIYEDDINYNVSFTLSIGIVFGFMFASALTLLSVITGFIQLRYIENWRKSKLIRAKILLTVALLLAVSSVNGIFFYTFTKSNDGTFLFIYIFPILNIMIISSSIALYIFGKKIRSIRKANVT